MENSFKVEPNIPLPNIPRGAQPSPARYPWAEMKIGDSFFIPLLNKTLINVRGGLQIDLKKYYLQEGVKIKITTRSIDNGLRVWRIK
jgi:hypothetical protein